MHRIIVGLGFGDEGKGTMTDYFTRLDKSEMVVRFSGGPQTAHNVVLPDGTHHTFAQFGSGTLAGAGTILSQYTLINLANMEREANALWEIIGHNPTENLYVSENTLVITPLHVFANRAYETRRGTSAHGSCGQGVGETVRYSVEYPGDEIRVQDLENEDILYDKLLLLEERLRGEYGNYLTDEELPSNIPMDVSWMRASYDRLNFNVLTDDEIIELIADMHNAGKSLVFEGTQGVLLDEWNGFHPHTTWATTTSQNAHVLLDAAGIPDEDRETVGVTRTYHTRHGYGPFPSEFAAGTHWNETHPEIHNARGKWQGAWRVGNLDLDLLDYAIRVDGHIDTLAVTHVDVANSHVSTLPGIILEVHGPDRLGDREEVTNLLFDNSVSRNHEVASVIDSITERTGVKVTYTSHGPTWEDKVCRPSILA